MKKHIVRAPQTDRYGFEVPTKLSELEDDIPSVADQYRLELTSVVQVSGAAPVTALFQVVVGTFTGADGTVVDTGTVVSQNAGFTLPTTGNLLITIPSTGVYAINLLASWRSTVDTNSGVGPIVTNYTLSLQTAGQGSTAAAQALFNGVAGIDNKMGPVSLGGTQLIVANTIVPLTAGDVWTFGSSVLSESPAIGGSGLLAAMQLSIVRIA